MSKVKEWNPYKDRPRPTIDCLLHEALLVQAWKKSHDYIRTNNWYADILELDISTATLPEMIRKWQLDFAEDGNDSLKPNTMRVVPAPKTWQWEFNNTPDNANEWHPKLHEDGKLNHLRPLAHLDIKSQSVATALMLCLADIVEDAQGNPESHKVNNEIAYSTVSYGNRLFCDWHPKKNMPAEFRWGNANCYRKFFTDYQSFLERPKEICRQHRRVIKGKKLAVISLDLTGFFDYVNVSSLIECLIQLCKQKKIIHDEAFWDAARAILQWTWNSNDQETYASSEIFRDGLPSGLPQGLVASGFFSNIAMLDFDKSLKNNAPKLFRGLLGKTLANKIKVIDYCRYVDDMRLVITHPEDLEHDEIKTSLTGSINSLLNTHCNGQKCNESKTDYLSLESIETKGSDAIMMKAIQTAISGPMDTSLMEETSIILNGLMNSIDFGAITKTSTATTTSTLDLANIHKQSREVRDDTIIRFVSYRQLKLLRARREQLGANATNEEAAYIDAEIEMAASKMAHLWALDPSLGIVLKHSLKLFPHLKIIEAVIESCKPYLSEATPTHGPAHLVVAYSIADILKFSAIELLQQNPELPQPDGCDLKKIKTSIVKLAKLVLKNENAPWYLMQQASIALIALGEQSFAREKLCKLRVTELQNYLKLTEIDLDINETELNPDGRALAIVARQFKPDDCDQQKPIKSYPCQSNKWLSLGRLIESKTNPFDNEYATLRLIEEILKQRNELNLSEGPLPPNSLQVKCSDWTDLSNPQVNAELDIRLAETSSNEYNAIYSPPHFADKETRYLMRVGMIARAAFIGSQDYTQAWRAPHFNRLGYKGIKSSWAKRRYGMFQRSDGLAGYSANCSSWFSELISRLLPWPGALVQEVSLTGWNKVKNPNDLLLLLEDQRKSLASSYCKASGMPTYKHHVSQDLFDDSALTVVMIQTVGPKRSDFASFKIDLSDPKYTKTRRDHLAAMLRLADSHLKTRETYGQSAKAHITILPEFSVHSDDLDLIERYVDRTKSIVFCGLVFHEHPEVNGKLVNSARWVIPDARSSGRSIRHFYQGKQHMTEIERKNKIQGYRPHQVILSVNDKKTKQSYNLTGCLCYDATDLDLASDLRNQTDFFIVAANNKDVSTFDNIAVSLNYLMYQHYAIINSGEFGGTLIHAPYNEKHERILTHQHGGLQAAVSIAKVDLSDWLNAPNKPDEKKKGSKKKKEEKAILQAKEMKTPPAGYKRRTPNK